MTYEKAYEAYLKDHKTRTALMDELDLDGFMAKSDDWRDILKAMRDRREKLNGG